MIGRDTRSVGGARGLGGQFFVKEAALLNVRREDFAFADVLVADRRGEVFPTQILWIGRRVGGVRRDVTGAAGDSDAIRPNERVVIVEVGVADEACPVPLLAGFFVKFWIGPRLISRELG